MVPIVIGVEDKSMADRALLAGYPRNIQYGDVSFTAGAPFIDMNNI